MRGMLAAGAAPPRSPGCGICQRSIPSRLAAGHLHRPPDPAQFTGVRAGMWHVYKSGLGRYESFRVKLEVPLQCNVLRVSHTHTHTRTHARTHARERLHLHACKTGWHRVRFTHTAQRETSICDHAMTVHTKQGKAERGSLLDGGFVQVMPGFRAGCLHGSPLLVSQPPRQLASRPARRQRSHALPGRGGPEAQYLEA